LPKTIEHRIAVEAGDRLIEVLRPLDAKQRAWAVAMACAECSRNEPEFVAMVAVILERCAR